MLILLELLTVVVFVHPLKCSASNRNFRLTNTNTDVSLGAAGTELRSVSVSPTVCRSRGRELLWDRGPRAWAARKTEDLLLWTRVAAVSRSSAAFPLPPSRLEKQILFLCRTPVPKPRGEHALQQCDLVPWSKRAARGRAFPPPSPAVCTCMPRGMKFSGTPVVLKKCLLPAQPVN